MSALATRRSRIRDFVPEVRRGVVRDVVGLVIEAEGLTAPVGALCKVLEASGSSRGDAEVVGFRADRTLLLSLGAMRGIERGDRVELVQKSQTVPVGFGLLGRVISARGEPIDGKGELSTTSTWPLYSRPSHPLSRPRISRRLGTGIRSVDTLLTCGSGQRVGIFAGSGVGKSVLMGMMTKFTDAEVIVIGLVGERGREVREFIERDLGEEGLRRAVVVVATSDEPACLRVKGAFTATAVAEFFRSQGKNVLLLVDSVTRVAHAQREIGLSVGEPPATRGYPPSVFALMPQLLERSGTSTEGSVTGFYTVLVEGDDLNEPVADTARSILDGHIALSRRLANRGHFPAVDVMESVSRVMFDIVPPEHMESARRMRDLLSAYAESEDLINIGAYVRGTNPRIDEALGKWERILAFLQQGRTERFDFDKELARLTELAAKPTAPSAPAGGRK
ncbi:MAG: FliI/YscN family ATPase [Planctomycetota bacterium]